MVNDTSIIESETINVEGRSVKIERRRGIIGDHIVDISARAYAIGIRLNESPEGVRAEPIMTIESSRSMVRVTQ